MWEAISELNFREEEIHFSRKMGYTHDANGYEEVWQKADTVQM